MISGRGEGRGRSRCFQTGFTTVELGIVLLVVLVMAVVSIPVALNTIRTFRRDAAALHVLSQIRATQSLATSRNAVVGFQWGPNAGRAADSYRIVRDSTGSCNFPTPSAPEDGASVLADWFDLGEAFPGLTIQSITDASSNSMGGVMFNPIGASVNTCTTVSFPLTVVLVDPMGRTRSIEITGAGLTRIL